MKLYYILECSDPDKKHLGLSWDQDIFLIKDGMVISCLDHCDAYREVPWILNSPTNLKYFNSTFLEPMFLKMKRISKRQAIAMQVMARLK